MHEAQQHEQDGVEQGDDAGHDADDLDRLPRDRRLEVGQPHQHPLLKPMQIGLGRKIGQDMLAESLGQRFGVRLSGAALDAGGFELFRVGQRINTMAA
jgi:hypothetical protein